jgi:hypothetical protein
MQVVLAGLSNWSVWAYLRDKPVDLQTTHAWQVWQVSALPTLGSV